VEQPYWKELLKRTRIEDAEKMRVFGKTIKTSDMPQRFPCDQGLVLPGGLKTNAFVFLQWHFNELTNEMPAISAQSETLIHRVLQTLIERHGVRSVILEGYGNDRLFEQNFQSEEERRNLPMTQIAHERCVNKIVAGAAKTHPALEKREAQDICLIDLFLKGDGIAHMKLLLSDNPSLRITGFETKDRLWDEVMEALKKLARKHQEAEGILVFQTSDRNGYLRKEVDIHGIRALAIKMGPQDNSESLLSLLMDADIAPLISPEVARKRLAEICRGSPDCQKRLPMYEESFLFWHRYGTYIEKVRSSHAVKSILLNSSHNTALVIGAGHRNSLAVKLGKVPFQYRPTVHFLEFECTNKDSFVTSNTRMLEIVDALIKNQQGKPSK